MNETKKDIFDIQEPEDDYKDILKTGISFEKRKEPAFSDEKTPEKKETKISMIKKKIEGIEIGKLVTVIYGSFNDQKVLNGKVASFVDDAVTIMPNDKEKTYPVVVLFDEIVDIFVVKKFRKEKKDLSLFKINKAIYEFFNGNEEEVKHAYEQKISVKKLRQELKQKTKNNKKG